MPELQRNEFRHAPASGGPRALLRRGALGLAFSASALLLAGCGGGGVDTVNLGISAVVAGQPVATVFQPGPVGSLDLSAGQSIELDANEPVNWSFSVGGSPLVGDGTTVYYDGLAITETSVTPSSVVLNTQVTGPYTSPVVVSMTATSTVDATVVTGVDLVVH
ncbi:MULTISPECIES: hypothetical protein [Ramlibacter]|uniref:PKD domain-containing protein n=1 Tax=Ramlibacter aquaticus TaxID=2780094 RepID=A0ABR9SIP3_9BURK|nr:MULTISPECIES: hypothetical protein [Ramlibacter]MBE7941887.1 hypothetical protein [Ramlibacter aquaticus]